MTSWLICACLGLMPGGNPSADYVRDRERAMELVRAGKHAEALTAFTRMAETAATALQKSDALRQAALSADSLKKPELALRLARAIPLPGHAKCCEMRLLESLRRWNDIINKFANEDLDALPESLRGDAFFGRGYAYFALKNGKAAVRDLQEAIEYLTDGNAGALCLICLGDTFRGLLKDDKQAIAAYRRAYPLGNIYKQCEAAMNVAAILQQRQPLAAVAELQRIKMKEVTSPFWRGRLLCALGDALAAAGKKSAAISSYSEALRLKGVPDDIRQRCEMAITRLGVEAHRCGRHGHGLAWPCEGGRGSCRAVNHLVLVAPRLRRSLALPKSNDLLLKDLWTDHLAKSALEAIVYTLGNEIFWF